MSEFVNETAAKRPKKEKGLTIRQERFCQYYAGECDGNGTQSAVKAGYSPGSAPQTAGDLLKYPHVKKRITMLLDQAARAAEVTIELVVSEHKKIATAQISEYYLPADGSGKLKIKPLELWTDSMRSAVKRMDLKDGHVTKLELHAKDPALTALAAIGGYVKPKRIEHSGNMNTVHRYDFSKMEKDEAFELIKLIEGQMETENEA